MAWRIDPDDVREIIDSDDDVEMAPFVRTANRVVDWLVAQDTDGLLGSNLPPEIEKYLAAHFYALKDPQYQTHSTAGASATYQGQTGMRFDLTWWGQMAQQLDVTGRLKNMGSPQASIHWLGLAPSEQTNYVDRD